MKTLLNSTDNFGFYDNNQNVYDAYYPGTESYGFQESHIAGGQANVAVPIFEPINITPITVENMNPIMTLTPTSSYFPITQPLFTTPIPVAPVFSAPKPVASVFSSPGFNDKITISTTVYDEKGYPLPDANIFIDEIAIASTYNNGTVTVPGIATNMSRVRITHVAMIDYEISAALLPKKVMMKLNINELDEVVIKPKPKPTTEAAAPAPVAKAGMSWLLWIALLAAGYKGMQYFKDDKPKTVKAKI